MPAVSSETQEHPRTSQSQNTSVPGIIEEYITQVSEEIEVNVTKQLSQHNSAGRSLAFCVLCLMSNLDEFLFNPQVRTLSGTVPGTSHNNDLENREPTGHRSQSDSRHEVEFSVSRTSNSIDFDPKETVAGCRL